MKALSAGQNMRIAEEYAATIGKLPPVVQQPPSPPADEKSSSSVELSEKQTTTRGPDEVGQTEKATIETVIEPIKTEKGSGGGHGSDTAARQDAARGEAGIGIREKRTRDDKAKKAARL